MTLHSCNDMHNRLFMYYNIIILAEPLTKKHFEDRYSETGHYFYELIEYIYPCIMLCFVVCCGIYEHIRTDSYQPRR